MNRTLSHLAILAMTGFLASCQTYEGPGQPIAVAPKPVGIDGEWVDTRGINSANFAGGTFTSTAIDTGQTMARGSYTYRDPQTVDLAFTSLLRNTTVNAACLLAGPSQLNCTSSSGAQFSLVRRAATPAAAAMVAPKPATQS
jgi:hypothetical protein